MQSHLIYWPVLVQILIPIVVLLLNARRKSVDVKAGSVDLKKAAIDNEAWSLPVVLTSKNLANQFQIPVLFYVTCLVLAAIDGVTIYTLSAAWLFVVSRLVHAWTHVTSNNISVRMPTFIVGVLLLVVLLVLAMMTLAAR
ncbi:MAG: MAPEG family protein [Pseudomonadota bacterium]